MLASASLRQALFDINVHRAGWIGCRHDKAGPCGQESASERGTSNMNSAHIAFLASIGMATARPSTMVG
jgi:hypothetical protein